MVMMIFPLDNSLLKPLILLFYNSIKSSCYPDIWKRSYLISYLFIIKGDKQLKTTGQFPCYEFLVKFLNR